MNVLSGANLAVLFGYTASSTMASSATSANPVDALLQAEQGQDKAIAAQAKQPDVQRDIAAFRTAVATAKDPKSLLANPTALKVLLTANGLGDQADYTALATKALLSSPSDPNGLANVLTDTRWKAANASLDFADNGLANISDPKVLDAIASGYAEISWRKSLDATTPGLSDALTFRATAAAATSADDILGNATLRRVVTTALGIPQEIAYQTLEAQEQAITSHLDIKQLQDPKFVERLAQRYLVTTAANNAGSSPASLDALAVQSFGLVV